MPYKKRNTKKFVKNQHRTSPNEAFENRVKSEMKQPFTFENYMKNFGANEKLYGELFVRRLRTGFYPSDEIVDRVMSSGNARYSEIQKVMGLSHMSASKV